MKRLTEESHKKSDDFTNTAYSWNYSFWRTTVYSAI